MYILTELKKSVVSVYSGNTLEYERVKHAIFRFLVQLGEKLMRKK